MAEIIGRFVVDILVLGAVDVLARLGYWIARFAVPLLTFGHIPVMPPPRHLAVSERWHGMHRLSDGSRIMGRKLASIVGLLILAAVLVLAAFVLALLRA